jgi:(R,R)-butanediol dehydrogenase/meso-butanediol dehydrogenase/diacetyl reductase
MRAAVFQGFDRPLAIEQRPEPRPAADQVLIRVARCGICGSDLHMTREPAFGVQPGTVLGHEFSGEVIELGSDASGIAIGDRVAVAPIRGCGSCASCRNGEPAWCDDMLLQGGGYAEVAIAASRQCLKLPAGASLEDGALVEPLAVALHGVMLSSLTPGSHVLVLGAGPIGLAVAFWARRLGATKVAVVDLTPLQADLALRVGATNWVQAGEDVVRRVNSELHGMPDIVFECVGRAGILAQALEHVRPRGSIVMLGLCTSPDSFIPFRAVSKEARFITSAFFNMREYEASLDMLDAGHAEARSLITSIVPLSQLPVTFESLRQRTSQCKVMVRPD